MGLFDVQGIDKDTLRELMNEAFSLYGTNAQLFEPLDSHKNSVGDEDFVHGKPIPISILFEESPKAKLAKLGWMVEGMETPVLAYILPIDSEGNKITIDRGAVIRIPYVSADDGYRDMFVGQVTTDSLNNLCYIAMLSQNRIQKVVKADTHTVTHELDITGNQFFKGTKL